MAVGRRGSDGYRAPPVLDGLLEEQQYQCISLWSSADSLRPLRNPSPLPAATGSISKQARRSVEQKARPSKFDPQEKAPHKRGFFFEFRSR